MADNDNQQDPLYHTRKMGAALREIRDHLRQDVLKVEDRSSRRYLGPPPTS